MKLYGILHSAVYIFHKLIFCSVLVVLFLTGCESASHSENHFEDIDIFQSEEPKSAKDALPQNTPDYIIQYECTEIISAISGVDLCFDPSAAAPRWIKLELVGYEGQPDTTGYFPSGWGIKAEIPILNRGTKDAVIKNGTRVVTFNTSKGIVDVVANGEIIVPARTGYKAGYAVVNAYFDSDLLQDGLTGIPCKKDEVPCNLNEVSYTVNPDGNIIGDNQDNNTGTLKIFHPSAYPRVVITDVILPEYIEHFGGNSFSSFEITVTGKNIGGPMTRPFYVKLDINNNIKWVTILDVQPLESGETFQETLTQYEGLDDHVVGDFSSGHVPVQARIQEVSVQVFGPYAWASLINTDFADFEEGGKYDYSQWKHIVRHANKQLDGYWDSPVERNSTDMVLGASNTWHDPTEAPSTETIKTIYGDVIKGVEVPGDYDGDAVTTTTGFAIKPSVPHLIYPDDGDIFRVSDYPPVILNDGLFTCLKPSEIEQYIDWAAANGTFHRFEEREVHPCFGIDSELNGLNFQTHVEQWPDSFLRFRWLPTINITEATPAKIEIRDVDHNLVHSADYPDGLTFAPRELAGVFTGMGMDELHGFVHYPDGRHYNEIYEYYLDLHGEYGEGLAKSNADEGYFNQYVYDGPSLEPGKYYWRVTNDLNSEEGSQVWSEEFNFTIQSTTEIPFWKQGVAISDPLKMAPGYGDTFIFSGEVINVYEGGFTLATDEGFVNLRTGTDTTIYSSVTGIHQEVPLGWKVMVSIDESPYLVGRTYVPYGSIPIANSVTEVIYGGEHHRCKVLGLTSAGKTAVSCNSGDYKLLEISAVPETAKTIVFIRTYKDCEVVTVTSAGKSHLHCEDASQFTVEMPLKQGLDIQIIGKSPQVISETGHVQEKISEFGITTTSMKRHEFSDVLGSFGHTLEPASKTAFTESISMASQEVQDYFIEITVFQKMIAEFTNLVGSTENDFIFDDRDVSGLIKQFESLLESHEYMVDLMIHRDLHNQSKQMRDQVIETIKSESTKFAPWAELKIQLQEAEYYAGQRNLLQVISVLGRNLK